MTLDLDFRATDEPCSEIALETIDGGRLVLSEAGRRLATDGSAVATGPDTEYPVHYRRFAALIAAGESDVDVTPLQLVADAFLVARITRGVAYEP